MEACEKYREALSLMAAGALGGDEGAPVRRHLETCRACRAYRASMQRLAQSLEALETENRSVEPSAALHERAESSILTAGKGAGRLEVLRPAGWRYAVAAACLLLVAAGAFYTAYRMLAGRKERDVAASARQVDRNLPYFAVYRQAVGGSPEDLDELLEAHSKYRPHNYGNPLAEPLGNSERGDLILKKERHNENVDIAGNSCGSVLRHGGRRNC